MVGYLEQGLSLEKIGVLVDRDPSTVSYWLKKHGLQAVGHERHSPKGSNVSREELRSLVAQGLVLREIADQLALSISTVRYWLQRHGIEARDRRGPRSRGGDDKPPTVRDVCPRHGLVEFVLENRGAYRCKRCRSDAVTRWRRRVKRRLIGEAGGECRLCGYSRYQGALQFHHLDPREKEFLISRNGATRSMAEVRREAAKCVLLCANCHAEVEAGVARLSSAA